MIPKMMKTKPMRNKTSSMSGMLSIKVATSTRIPGMPLIVRRGLSALNARSPDTLVDALGMKTVKLTPTVARSSHDHESRR
jgi:hypothetical protein